MVELSDVIASNERIASTFPQGLVAVFVGGTSGVGEFTLKKLAKYTPKLRAYIVGRSQEAADRIIEECKQLNNGGRFEFIKADVGGLKSVDDVCRQIKSKETAINILFQSQGTMAFNQKSPEGLPLASSLIILSRLRFIVNLLPLVQSANSLRRIVSVGAATCEGAIDMNNFYGEGMPLMQWRDHGASIHTLSLEEVATRAPDVSFCHDVPGVVKSGITRGAEGFKLKLMIAISNLLSPFIAVPPDECGERHVFLATSARFCPRQGGAAVAGVALGGTLEVATGSDGNTGSGVYSIDNKGESAPPRVYEVLARFREDGTARKVWEKIAGDLKRFTGTEVA